MHARIYRSSRLFMTLREIFSHDRYKKKAPSMLHGNQFQSRNVPRTAAVVLILFVNKCIPGRSFVRPSTTIVRRRPYSVLVSLSTSFTCHMVEISPRDGVIW